MLIGGMCRRQRELLAEPQTRVAEDDCRVQGDEGEGEIRMDFLQLSRLLLPIIVLRLVCLTWLRRGRTPKIEPGWILRMDLRDESHNVGVQDFSWKVAKFSPASYFLHEFSKQHRPLLK
jgi:hypothetical protein